MINVKFQSINDSNPYAQLRSVRRTKITTEKGEISSPCRAATDYEFKQKRNLPTEVKLPNVIVTNNIELNGDDLQRFLNENKAFQNIASTIQMEKDVQHQSSSIFNFSFTRSGKKPSLAAMRTESTRRSFLNRAKDIQIEKEIPNISIPFLDLPLAEYKFELRLLKKAIEKNGNNYCIIPVLDMKYERFKEILKFCVLELGLNFITIVYRDFETVGPRYYDVRDYDTKDVGFLVVQVPRSDPAFNNLSSMHYLPFRIGDIFSVRTRMPKKGIPPKKGETKEQFEERMKPDLSRLKFFLRSSLEVAPVPQLIPNWKTVGKNVIADLGAEDKTTEDIVSNIEASQKEKDVFKTAIALTKVHELLASTKEFELFETMIKENDIKTYVDSKPTLDHLLKIFDGQTSL